jgi:hypothetical protein
VAHQQASQVFVWLAALGGTAFVLGGMNMLIYRGQAHASQRLDPFIRGQVKFDLATRRYMFYAGLATLPVGVLGLVFHW